MWVIEDLCDYWVDHPPIHELAAAWMGVKPRSVPTSLSDSTDPSGIAALIGLYPDGRVPAGR